jgi:hypothetical protein
MPKGVYERKPGLRRGPYGQARPRPGTGGKGKQHMPAERGPLESAIAEAIEFGWWEQGLDPLPPKWRERVDRIKAKRQYG